MSRGFNKQNMWISLKLWGLKTKFLLVRIIGLAGILLALFGGYTIIQPGWSVSLSSSLVGALPLVNDLTMLDGVFMLAIGGVLVAVSTRT